MDVNGLMWLAMIIPTLGVLILRFGFNKSVALWEYAVAFFVPILVIVISGMIAKTTIAYDTEYWNHEVESVRWYEAWDEWISQMCPYDCNCTTDDDGFTTCQTCWEDCSYREYHPEYWTKECTDGFTFRITEAEYNRVARKFGTQRQFVDMHRDYDLNDGDMYQYSWPGNDPTLELAVSSHRYENRIQVSENTFKFPDVDTSLVRRYKLYEYPGVSRNNVQEHWLGPVPPGVTKKHVEQQLAIINARLCEKPGSTKKVKVFYAIFKNQPREAGIKQEWHWDGGNKNEFVVCLGVNGNWDIQWVHPFSWTKNKNNQVKVKNETQLLDSLDLAQVFNITRTTLDKHWERREFSEFHYLMIQATPGQMATILIIAFIVTLGLMIFVIRNDIDGDGLSSYDRRWRNFHKRRF